MKKTQQHTPKQIQKYNAAFIEFMKPSEEKTDGEESKFCMPALPLLTLKGVKKVATDNETKQPEDKTL